jgi:predicted kinase
LAALPIFLSARATVRAKVSASAEASQAEAEAKAHLHDEAIAYFRLAAAYLDPPPPRLVAIGGLSGTGKTSLARRLAPDLGAAPGALHLRSDVLRKRLSGVDELTPLPQAAYGSAMTARVYGGILERARDALGAGHSVIVDAVYAKAAERAALEAAARDLDVAFQGLWLQAPEPVMAERVSGAPTAGLPDRRGDLAAHRRLRPARRRGCRRGEGPHGDGLEDPAIRSEVERRQQPLTHFALSLNSMVRPLSGRRTGTFVALMNLSVLVPGRSLPSMVVASLAWEAITASGLTSLLMTKAASSGPVEKMPPMFMTTRLAFRKRRTTVSCSAVIPVSPER